MRKLFFFLSAVTFSFISSCQESRSKYNLGEIETRSGAKREVNLVGPDDSKYYDYIQIGRDDKKLYTPSLNPKDGIIWCNRIVTISDIPEFWRIEIFRVGKEEKVEKEETFSSIGIVSPEYSKYQLKTHRSEKLELYFPEIKGDLKHILKKECP